MTEHRELKLSMNRNTRSSDQSTAAAKRRFSLKDRNDKDCRKQDLYDSVTAQVESQQWAFCSYGWFGVLVDGDQSFCRSRVIVGANTEIHWASASTPKRLVSIRGSK